MMPRKRAACCWNGGGMPRRERGGGRRQRGSTRWPAGSTPWADPTRGACWALARRALLQTVIDELPSGVYLVRGPDARLVLANRAAAAVWGAPWRQGQPMSEFLATNGIRVFHVDGRPFAPEEFATLRAEDPNAI